ncbi:MAG: AMP-binding protein [Bacteroidales bacterium]|nr:AMP-binding protein [Bacteroidales bacterium]
MFNEYVLDHLINSIRKFANRNAFCINDEFFSYEVFFGYVSKIRSLIKKSDLEGKITGVVANDDIETYASIIAVWMEGLAYTPLHPNQPFERNTDIIDQADIQIILDSSKATVYGSLNAIPTKGQTDSKLNLEYKSCSDHELAYILFTSGSTGKPKGVAISRKNVGAFMRSFWKSGIIIDENDRCLQCFDLTFDVSVQSFLVPLTRGACVYTIPHDQIKYSYVYGLLEDHKLTFGAMAPSMIRYLRPYFSEIDAPAMRYNILTAEASPVDLIEEWAQCIPNAEIFDFYGPTEATIYCTYHRFKRNAENKQLNGMLSIGKPMNGLKAIIIDENKKNLGTGQKGELCISGDQLTPGYWKNDQKNKESFFEIEIDGKHTRFYKTGDSCYFDDEGDIMLAGRLDHQVKIQGYRIELGEIEYHAREFLQGSNAVAIAFDNETGNTEIALFIEKERENLEPIRNYLQTKLPQYMIPTKYYINNSFPLNANGKVDRNMLKKTIKI